MEYNVYCDESCHLLYDHSDVMVIGAVWCDRQNKKQIFKDIRDIKIKHGLDSWFEIKWTKVSIAKADFYLELIDYFITNDLLHYRGLIAKDKKALNHEKFNNGSHDLWYYKMYYYMLDNITELNNEYYIFVDIKDTLGGKRTRKLHEVLCNNVYDFNCDVIKSIMQINSRESEILQLADLINGALGYFHRGLYDTGKNEAKKLLINKLCEHYTLDKISKRHDQKFNVFIWRGRE